jgi:hypothetical protein
MGHERLALEVRTRIWFRLQTVFASPFLLTSHEARAIDTPAATGACERTQPVDVLSQFLRRNVALLERSG